jgi:hypothetical protein
MDQGLSYRVYYLLSVTPLHKWAKGNDIWALVAVLAVAQEDNKHEQYLVNGIPTEIQTVIKQHDDLFEAPSTLPPNGAFDHSIAPHPRSVPMDCKPYSYSPQQKDEIERQLAEILKASLVVPSMSHHASPALLVKKKDGSWRFCVDYKKLNASTIKNKFPMLIIDEFLDEIVVAKYFTKLHLNLGFHQIRM